MADVNITYETLYEILRNEKSREDIQEIPKSFYEDIVEYLKSNKKIYDDAILTGAPEDEREDIERQLKNIKLLIKEIYERREKKIMNLALNTSRTKSIGSDMDYMLYAEKELHDTLVSIFDSQRLNVLNRILLCKIPLNVDPAQQFEHQKSNENIITSDHEQNEMAQETNLANELKPSNMPKVEISAADELGDGKKTLRFREKVPKFIDKEFEVYGPYEVNEVVNLPSELAHILIRNGKAEEIGEN